MTIKRAISELESLQGLTVKSGAYSRTFSHDERQPYTLDILKTLQDFELNQRESKQLIAAHHNNETSGLGFSYSGGGNTYNWNANISHDLDWNHYEKDGRSFYIVRVHIGIDIRGGYTCEFVLTFEKPLEFFEVIELHECSYIESANGRSFFITVRPLTEEITAIDIESEEQFYFYDIDELEAATKKEEAQQ